jgi:hypothetical protein
MPIYYRFFTRLGRPQGDRLAYEPKDLLGAPERSI